MLRATLGNWVSYLTTLAAQIALASRFGSGPEASAYAIALGLVIALSGVLVTALQTVAIPRILTHNSSLRVDVVRVVVGVATASLALSALVVLLADPISGLYSTHGGLPHDLMQSLLVLAGIAIPIRFAAGAVEALAIARGQRFLPTAAQTLPTLFALLAIVVDSRIDVAQVLMAFVLGSVAECGLVAVFQLPIRTRTEEGDPSRAGIVMLATVGSTLLLSMLPPIERALSALYGSGEAARYDYALRSLLAVQLLVVGGAVIASLGSWSSLTGPENRPRLQKAVARATTVVCLLLGLTAAIALVGGHAIVQLVYQRGRFTTTDTDRVTLIILVALPGYLAQGPTLMLTAALSALRRNGWLVAASVGHFSVRIALLLVLTPKWGGAGAAAAYSMCSVGVLVVVVALARRDGLWPDTGTSIVLHVASIVAVLAALSVGELLIGPALAFWPRVGVLCLVFAAMSWRLPAMLQRTWATDLVESPQTAG